ncbi:MAG: glycoside hydrolase, partial [Planctomycetes bacterium]|nr:glycoside hydrolase [Planctomycetota bacterium]
SQAWMILAGVMSPEEGRAAWTALACDPEAVRPAGAYLYHHVVEAMLACGMRDEARALVVDYWGGMVDRGADTFWEVYDPADARFSPYGNHKINSYCHAWSCTPAYFIRRKGLGKTA